MQMGVMKGWRRERGRRSILDAGWAGAGVSMFCVDVEGVTAKVALGVMGRQCMGCFYALKLNGARTNGFAQLGAWIEGVEAMLARWRVVDSFACRMRVIFGSTIMLPKSRETLVSIPFVWIDSLSHPREGICR